MKLSKASRPSPALVLAALALVFAMVGTAIAGPDAISNKITKSKVKKVSKKQANKVLDQRESSLSVRNANELDNLDSDQFLRSNAVAAAGNASSEDINDFTTATYTTVLSKSFTAPTGGFALITGTVGGGDDLSLGGAGALYSRIAVDGTPTTDDQFNSPVLGITPSVYGTGTNTVLVPVTAGAHEAHVQIREGGTGSYVFSRQITVLFIPNGEPTPVPYSDRHGADVGSMGQ